MWLTFVVFVYSLTRTYDQATGTALRPVSACWTITVNWSRYLLPLIARGFEGASVGSITTTTKPILVRGLSRTSRIALPGWSGRTDRAAILVPPLSIRLLLCNLDPIPFCSRKLFSKEAPASPLRYHDNHVKSNSLYCCIARAAFKYIW